MKTAVKLEVITYFFKLNILELSRILGVTIKEIDLFDDVTINNHKPRIDRLCTICETAMAHADFQDIRYAPYLHKKMAGMRDSLYNLLKEKDLVEDDIMRVVEIISHAYKIEKKRREDHAAILKKHGFEEISDEEIEERMQDPDFWA